MLETILNNKEWVFSGIGVAVASAIAAWLLRKPRSSRLSQKSGRDSTNIQAGGDVTISGKRPKG